MYSMRVINKLVSSLSSDVALSQVASSHPHLTRLRLMSRVHLLIQKVDRTIVQWSTCSKNI